jgi:hypothetical protein
MGSGPEGAAGVAADGVSDRGRGLPRLAAPAGRAAAPRRWRGALAASPWLEPDEQAARDELPTIFPFRVLRSAGESLAVEATRQVWRWLREDISERLPAAAPKAERRLGALACQVGQPIAIGAAGALRICIGAHLVAAVAFDPALGKTVALRLERQIGRARLVLDKAALIARYFDALVASTE